MTTKPKPENDAPNRFIGVDHGPIRAVIGPVLWVCRAPRCQCVTPCDAIAIEPYDDQGEE